MLSVAKEDEEKLRLAVNNMMRLCSHISAVNPPPLTAEEQKELDEIRQMYALDLHDDVVETSDVDVLDHAPKRHGRFYPTP